MLLNSAKGRAKLRARLAHLSDLDAAYVRQMAPSGQNAADIINQLKKSGAPDECHIIAEHPDYDQKLMPLEDAFAQLFASGIAYFISCLPGKLAYYEGETMHERYILRKD